MAYVKKEVKDLAKQMGSVEERGILNPLHFIGLGYEGVKKTKDSETYYGFHIAHNFDFMREVYSNSEKEIKQAYENGLSTHSKPIEDDFLYPLECNWVLTPEVIMSDFIESVKIAKVKLNPRTRMLNEYGNPRGTEIFSSRLMVDDPLSHIGYRNNFLFWTEMSLEKSGARPYVCSGIFPNRMLKCFSHLIESPPLKEMFIVENLGLVFEAYTTTLKRFINKKRKGNPSLETSVKKIDGWKICQENSLGYQFNEGLKRFWDIYEED